MGIYQNNVRENFSQHTKRRKHHHSKVWKKKEVQSEICGIAQYTNRIDSGGTENMKFQCPNSHTQLPRGQVASIHEFEAA